MQTRFGFSARTIMVIVGFWWAGAAAAGDDWSIDWYSIDGGGTLNASGGDWSLSGTIGQADATPANGMTGGDIQLTGGFWALVAEFADQLFSDRFQSNALMHKEDDHE